MIIGKFTRTDHGFQGVIETLTIDRHVIIEGVQDKGSNPKAPDYRILVGNSDIGAGWNKLTEDGTRHYVSVSIDDPSWPAKRSCTLVKTGAEQVHTLYWSREDRKRGSR
jgi:uncharacterized protein (DUF736 family)